MVDKVEQVLRYIEEFGRNNPMFNVPRETGEFLNSLVKKNKPNNILEIGTSNGYSTIWLARDGDKVVTIEQDHDKVVLAKASFEAAGLKNIEVLEGNALEILEKLGEFDFVFIDAVKREYVEYVKKIKLSEKAIIVADNIISHKDKVQDYLDYVREKFDSKLVEIGTGLEVSELIGS